MQQDAGKDNVKENKTAASSNGSDNENQDTGLMAISLVLNMLEIPVRTDELHRHVGSPEKFSVNDIVQAAAACNASAEHMQSSIERTANLPLPFIALTKNQSSKNQDYLVVVKVTKEGYSTIDPRKIDSASKDKQVLSVQAFSECWSGEVVLVKKGSTKSKFDFGLSWFWPTLSQHRSAFNNVLIASLLIQIFALVTPLFTMIIIDKVLTTSGYSTLDVLIMGLAAIAVFDFIIGSLRSHLLGDLTNRMDAELMATLFRHLMRLPMSFFSSRKTGDIVSRIKELEVVRNFFSGPAVTAVIDFPFTLVFIVVMYLFSPLLTFVVVLAVVTLLILYGVMGGRIRKRIREKSLANSDNQSFLVEGISSIEMIKSLSVEPQVQRQWEEQVVQSSATSVETETLNHTLSQAAGFINKLTIAIALWLGARAVLQGDMTAGQLIGFNMMISRVLAPAMRIAQLFQHIQQSQVSVQRVKEIFATPAECTTPNPAKGLPALKGEVIFDDVSFAYDGEHFVVENINFYIKPGEVIGVTGASGSGKSTLVKLLQRLYLPQKGRILVDGINIGQIDPTWLRRQIGVVTQENILLNQSIRNNITIADPGISVERVEAAARLAGADTFIRALPEAYNTVVGERGSMLSMGQRQRIALARALVMNPKLLILDEATSSLDSEAEMAIQANMQQIAQGRTVFIIAHRLSTLADTDRIMTLEHGRLLEFESIDKLMANNGRFAALYKLQTQAITQTQPATS